MIALATLAIGAPAAEAKLTSSFAGGVLAISGDDRDDRVVVSCVNGSVKVEGGNLKGRPVPCAQVVEIDALTAGGDDVIDFRGVNREFGRAKFRGFGTGTGVAAIAGPGNDRFFGSPASFNLFYGQGGKDRAIGGPRRDLLSGGAGKDLLRGAGARDTLLGNGGHDRIFGGGGADTINGHAGNDRLSGGRGNDALGGGTGRDRLFGGPGRDKLVGGLGRDVLRGGPGRDREIQNPGDPKQIR